MINNNVDKHDICLELFDRYISDDYTPAHLVSSHWKNLHQELVVTKKNGEIESMKGVGFGDMGQRGFLVKLLSCVTVLIYILKLPHRSEIFNLIKVARFVCARMGISFSYDCFRQICALRLIREYAPAREKFVCLIIGDGYGFLSCFIKELYPECKIILIDLGKTLLFQAKNCQQAFPSARHGLIDSLGNSCIVEDADFIYCPAEHIDSIEKSTHIHWAVNIASMQEMNIETVDNYFHFLRKMLAPDNLFSVVTGKKKRCQVERSLAFMIIPGMPMMNI
jgi:putative sugar O-methyltransferase